MRRRTLALTSASALVVAMTVLPSIGAAAAEPLSDGAYSFDVAGASVEVVVDAGDAAHVAPEGYEVDFRVDEDGLVLNEVVVSVTGELGTVEYDVVIDVDEVDHDGDGQLDYSVIVVQAPDGLDDPLLEEGGEEPAVDGSEQPAVDGSEEPVIEEFGDDLATDDEAGTEDDEAAGTDRGATVSMVAQCAPRGRDARAAGLPNHGYFVSAAARGETVPWTIGDGTGGEMADEMADLSTLEGATAFCDAVTSDDGEVVVEEEPVGTDEEPATTEEEPTVGTELRGEDADDGSSDLVRSLDGGDSERRGGPPDSVGAGHGRSGPTQDVGRGEGRGGPPQGVPGRGPRG